MVTLSDEASSPKRRNKPEAAGVGHLFELKLPIPLRLTDLGDGED
jgi:hypothetical protein